MQLDNIQRKSDEWSWNKNWNKKGWNEMGSNRKCTEVEYDQKEVSVVLPE